MKNYICIGETKIEISCETAENLKKQFGEKPREIRHGDYGYWKNGLPYMAIKRDDKQLHEWACDEHLVTAKGNWNFGMDDKFTPFGNIFDDLKRLSEDLEFTESICSNGYHAHARLDKDGTIYLYSGWDNKGDDKGYAHLEDVITFHQKLGQLIATAKRRKKDC